MCSYALGDLLEMAGYGLTQRAASSVQISGLCSDPYRVRRLCQKPPSHCHRAGVLAVWAPKAAKLSACLDEQPPADLLMCSLAGRAV